LHVTVKITVMIWNAYPDKAKKQSRIADFAPPPAQFKDAETKTDRQTYRDLRRDYTQILQYKTQYWQRVSSNHEVAVTNGAN